MGKKRKPNPMRGIRMMGRSFELNIQRNGERQFINLETDDPAEAIQRAIKIRTDPTLQPESGFKKEIERFIAYKRKQKEYTEQTARSKKNIVLSFYSHLPEAVTPAKVTSAQVQGWHDKLVDEGLHSSTIHSYIMAVQAFFNWTITVAKIRRHHPMTGLRLVKLEGRARDSFCSFEERDRLINECDDEELKFILYCGFHAGMRFNEIVQAVPMWFDLTAGRIDLRKTPTMAFKDREERSVPMTREFRAFLAIYGKPHPFMIAPKAKKGKWVYRYDFRAKFMTFVDKKGLGWVTPHIMRHTFASLLVSAGESIYKVAVWMGDDVATVQKHYGHLAPDEGGIEKAFSDRHKVKPKPPQKKPRATRRKKAGRKPRRAPSRRSAPDDGADTPP